MQDSEDQLDADLLVQEWQYVSENPHTVDPTPRT